MNCGFFATQSTLISMRWDEEDLIERKLEFVAILMESLRSFLGLGTLGFDKLLVFIVETCQFVNHCRLTHGGNADRLVEGLDDFFDCFITRGL